jgi:hypothetical protein
MLQRLVPVPQQPKSNIHQGGSREGPRPGNHIASDELGHIDSADIHGDTTARYCLIHFGLVRLQASDSSSQTLRQYLDFLPYSEGSIQQRSCHHGTETCDREHPIQR